MGLRKLIIVLIAAWSTSLIAGCSGNKAGTASGSAASAGGTSVAATAPETPDLTKPFHFTYDESGDETEPLGFARLLADSAGGTWIVFADKPLDDIKWQYSGGQSMNVNDALIAIRKAGTPVSWDTSHGYALVDFGTPEEFASLQKQPPAETLGIFMRSDSGNGLIKAIDDLWHISIAPEPGLLDQRMAFLAGHNLKPVSDTSPMNAMEFARDIAENAASSLGAPAMEIKVVQRASESDLLQQVAQYVGAKLVGGPTDWQLARYKDRQEIEAQATQLQGKIAQDQSAAVQAFSSFASRHGDDSDGGSSSDPTITDISDLPTLTQDTRNAFDELGMLGDPAVPALAGFLDPTKPALALAAMQTLDVLASPASEKALDDFAQRLHPPGQKPSGATTALDSQLIPMITEHPGPATTPMLTTIALDTTEPASLRTEARMAVVRSGDLAVFASKNTSRKLTVSETAFVLTNPPGGVAPLASTAPAAADAITPLATTVAPGGDGWAVFVSGRYGDPNDLWLAHGHGRQWTEFLFTGRQFTSSENSGFGGDQSSPKPGSCILSVAGDKVVIAPPKANQQALLQQLQQKMMNPKLSTADRAKVAQQYEKLAQSSSTNTLSTTITLSLAALRKDSDHDGLTDLVEERFGTDPNKADTDGDGTPDGADNNPLGGPVNTSDRGQMLQDIFTALYGGDMSPEPIVVVLDKPYWQPFFGAKARVLLMTPDDYLKRAVHLSALRVLEFGGPADSSSTILQPDGPCLFNDSHSKAEVHFWQMNGSPSDMAAYISEAMSAEGQNPITDYVAIFQKDGSWKLTSIGPWKFHTAAGAYQQLMRQQMGQIYGGAYGG